MSDIGVGEDARRVSLERADAARATINEAIRRIESLEGNEIYRRAWKAAIIALKGMAITIC